MDSACEEAGPREPTEVCHSKVKCAAIIDIQKELSDCPANIDVQKEAAGDTSVDSQTSKKDPPSVSDGRITEAPKQGKKSDTPLPTMLFLLIFLNTAPNFHEYTKPVAVTFLYQESSFFH